MPLFTTCISRVDFSETTLSFGASLFEWNPYLFNLRPHQTNLNFKLKHLHLSTSWGRTGSSQSLLRLNLPVYFGPFIRCHPGWNKELYCFGLEEKGLKAERRGRAARWSKMGRNVVRRTCVSSAGRLLEPGLCSQSSHLLPRGAKRSPLASVDTVKGFVFFTATEGRMCLSSWETPFVTILYILAITHTWSLTETGAHIICSFRLKKKKIEKVQFTKMMIHFKTCFHGGLGLGWKSLSDKVISYQHTTPTSTLLSN